jgi:cytochrome c551
VKYLPIRLFIFPGYGVIFFGQPKTRKNKCGGYQRMRKVGFLLVMSAILIALSACGGSKDSNNATPAPTQTQTPAETQAPDTGAATGGAVDAEKAQSIYQSNCMACHAADMSGGMGPALKDIGARLSQDQIAGIITNGQGRMPGFSGRLSDEDVNTLAAWLATQKG